MTAAAAVQEVGAAFVPSPAETVAEALAAYTAIDARLIRARAKLAQIEADHLEAKRRVVLAAGDRRTLIHGDSVVYVGRINASPYVRIEKAQAVT